MGQIQMVKWDMAKLSRGNDQLTLIVISEGLASMGYFEQAAAAAARIDEPFAKAGALAAVAQATAQVASATKNTELLQQAAAVAARIDNSFSKARALAAVAQATAKLGHWRQARGYAEQNTTHEGKAQALIRILQVWHGTDEKIAEKKNAADHPEF